MVRTKSFTDRFSSLSDNINEWLDDSKKILDFSHNTVVVTKGTDVKVENHVPIFYEDKEAKDNG